jgi:hypothetical protein
LQKIGVVGNVIIGSVIAEDDPEIVRLFVVVRQIKPVPQLGPETLGKKKA